MNERQRMVQVWKKRAGFPAKTMRLEDLDPPKVVLDWADNWCQHGGTKGLALVGPPGHGKTTLAVALAEYVLENVKRETLGWTEEDQVLPRQPVVYAPYSYYLHQKKLAWKLEKQNLTDTDDYGAIEELLGAVGLETHDPRYHARLAVLDDTGKEYDSGSGWAASELNGLLRLRHHYGYATIVTSNDPLSLWGVKYNAALASFAKEAFTEVKFISSVGDRR